MPAAAGEARAASIDPILPDDRYERSEVAAIESGLAHERLTHTLRRLDASEMTTTDEKELTDLRSQMQSIAEQENGRTTVQAVGPGVGPLAADGASTFAKTVTDLDSSISTTRTRRLARRAAAP